MIRALLRIATFLGIALFSLGVWYWIIEGARWAVSKVIARIG